MHLQLLSVWKRSRLGAKIAAIAVCVYLIYVLAGFFLAPKIIRSTIQGHLSGASHRVAKVAGVGFNPFSLALNIRGIKIKRKEESTPLFAADGVHLNLQTISLLRGALVLKEFKISRPEINLEFYGQGRYNISDLIPPHKEKQKREKDKGLLPFTIRGVSVKNGTLRFRDHPRGKTHLMDRFNFSLPRISSRKEDKEEVLRPQMSFRLNGDRIDINAQTRPFISNKDTQIKLSFPEIDLVPYWGYLPLAQKLRLSQGRFSGEFKLGFRIPGKGMDINLSGESRFKSIHLEEKDGTKVFACRRAEIDLQGFSLLEDYLHLGKIALDKTRMVISRDKNGTLNYLKYLPTPPETQNGKREAHHSPASSASSSGLHFRCARLLLPDLHIHYTDQNTSPSFKRSFHVNASAQELSNKGKSPGAITVHIQGKETGTLALNGSLHVADKKADLQFGFSRLPVPDYAPYFQHFIPWEILSATLSGKGRLQYKGGKKGNIRITGGKLGLSGLKMGNSGASPLIRAQHIQARGVEMDKREKHLLVDSFSLDNSSTKITRKANGKLDIMHGLREKYPPADKARKNGDSHADTWDIKVRQVGFRDCRAEFLDRDAPGDSQAHTHILGEKFSLRNLELPGPASPLFRFQGRIEKTGKIQLSGDLQLSPFQAHIRGELRGIPLSAANDYLPQKMKMETKNGTLEANFRTRLGEKKRFKMETKGNGTLHHLDIRDNQNNALLGLDRLGFWGLNLHIHPNKMNLKAISCSKPYLNLERGPEGVLNITRAMGGSVEEEKRPPQKEPFFQNLDIRKVRIEKGKLHFRDRKVSPEYKTAISKLECRLAGLNGTVQQPAQLSLNATKDGYSSLYFQGEIAPFSSPLYSDLDFSVQGMDMVSLTPYIRNYLGYPVQTGKLNWNGNFYTRNATLKMDNLFLIEQLELGPAPEGKETPNVPIKLAMSLLKDSDGDMELDIPVQGDLENPQFSLDKVIFKAVIGVFTKIATAPFSIIGSMFGGGEEVNHIPYAPGENEIGKKARDKLETIVTALLERPQLRLSVLGRSNPEKDIPALARKRFKHRLRLEKYRLLRSEDKNPRNPDKMRILRKESPKYVKMAYARLRKKNKNRFPPPGKISVTEMEKRLKDFLRPSRKDMQDLALERARKVRAYIVRQNPKLGKRIFLRHETKIKDSTTKKSEAVLKVN